MTARLLRTEKMLVGAGAQAKPPPLTGAQACLATTGPAPPRSSFHCQPVWMKSHGHAEGQAAYAVGTGSAPLAASTRTSRTAFTAQSRRNVAAAARRSRSGSAGSNSRGGEEGDSSAGTSGGAVAVVERVEARDLADEAHDSYLSVRYYVCAAGSYDVPFST
jgi:hypothetical protein